MGSIDFPLMPPIRELCQVITGGIAAGRQERRRSRHSRCCLMPNRALIVDGAGRDWHLLSSYTISCTMPIGYSDCTLSRRLLHAQRFWRLPTSFPIEIVARVQRNFYKIGRPHAVNNLGMGKGSPWNTKTVDPLLIKVSL